MGARGLYGRVRARSAAGAPVATRSISTIINNVFIADDWELAAASVAPISDGSILAAGVLPVAIIPFKKKARAKRFEQTVQPHLKGMYRFAYRLTGRQEDAEDLVQDVLTRLYPRAEELFGIEKPGAWLNQVLYRQFIDMTRRSAWHSERVASDVVSAEAAQDFFDSLLSVEKAPEWFISQDQLRAAVSRALDGLSPDERSLLLMHDVDGWKQQDIAYVLDIAVGTVKSRLNRCRTRLRAELSEVLEPFLDEIRSSKQR